MRGSTRRHRPSRHRADARGARLAFTAPSELAAARCASLSVLLPCTARPCAAASGCGSGARAQMSSAARRRDSPHARPWLILVVAAVALLRLLVRFVLRRRVRKGVVAFFHPFTNDGGGGERVLWCAVRAIQAAAPHVQVFIYTGDATPAAELAERAHALFGVPPLRPVACVRLRCRGAVLAKAYPVATLLGQALGSVLLAAEALLRLTPELFIDTAGYAFTYPLAAAFGARVACYTHYPMVSTDMLRAVASRAPSFNNGERVARSPLLSAAKLAYYRALAAAYGAAGRCAHVAMVNSSWTSDHISELWDVEPELVFPPCDTAALRALPLARPASPRLVVSVAQFRPEKAHAMQLRAWAAMRARAGALGAADAATLTAARLVLVGGVRGVEDAARLDSLRKLAAQLRLGDSVSFLVGVPAAQLRQTLAAAHVGLHTMRDEHFGISVVEYMAAGAVPLAHDSAGPRMDIVAARAPGQPRPGRLADSEAGFAAALEELLLMPEQQRLQLAAAAREATGRFSEDAFAEGIIAALRRVLPRGSGAARAQQPAWAKAD